MWIEFGVHNGYCFLHKTEESLEKQIIGRAQRHGRKNKLNLWYLMHENEKVITTKKTICDNLVKQFFIGESIIDSIPSTIPNAFNFDDGYNATIGDDEQITSLNSISLK